MEARGSATPSDWPWRHGFVKTKGEMAFLLQIENNKMVSPTVDNKPNAKMISPANDDRPEKMFSPMVDNKPKTKMVFLARYDGPEK